MGEPDMGPPRCPRKLGFVLLSLSSGQMVPAACDANFCEYCAPRRASVIAKCISLATPQRAVRLSKLTGVWRVDRNRVKDLAYRVRRAGYAWEAAYHLEANPKGTGFHAHLWQHGDYIPQAELQELCRSVGLGIPYINRMRQQVGRGGGVRYGLKGVSYGMKSDDLEGYLSINGNRLVHASRDFWRDGLDGERLTLETARERVRPSSADEGPWVLRAEL